VLERQRAYTIVNAPRVSTVPDSGLKRHLSLPKQTSSDAGSSSAPVCPSREERATKRAALVMPRDVMPVELREGHVPRITSNGPDSCVVGYALVPAFSNGKVYNLSMLAAEKRV
jgi:hypothetical protein